MPICPKCGKLISAKKFTRHKLRCGTSHRREPRPIQQTTMW
jgi:hypothetical protein